MSVLPLCFDEYYFNPKRHQHRHPINDFGFGLNPTELTAILALPTDLRQLHNRTRPTFKKCCTYESLPTTGKDGFQVCLDVQQFIPNEISVKTVDNSIIIEGKHKEREDEHGFISRQFTRRYVLPKSYDPNTVTSSLSSDGVLTIKSPPPKALGSNERIIEIQHTGPARLVVKENEPHENGEHEVKPEEEAEEKN